ncbi:MAG: hemerythrin domain-containing protein [Planctomycetota bacterium]|jgi:iron-sulfur cluster repair protein YtfE (RIC family)
MPESPRPHDDPREKNPEFVNLTRELQNCTDLDVMGETLAKLRAVLVQHFKGEEASEGLFEVITQKAPQHSHTIERLIEEHRAMLNGLDDLSERVQNFKKDIAKITEEFGAGLEKHETEEVDLYNDTLIIEYGGQG